MAGHGKVQGAVEVAQPPRSCVACRSVKGVNLAPVVPIQLPTSRRNGRIRRFDISTEPVAKSGRDGARTSHKCANAVRNRQTGRDALRRVRIDSKGWNEVLIVSEYNDELSETRNRINAELEHPKTRYVFYRESRHGARWYKFYGKFRIDEVATRATLSSERPSVIYRRESNEIECQKIAA